VQHANKLSTVNGHVSLARNFCQ